MGLGVFRKGLNLIRIETVVIKKIEHLQRLIRCNYSHKQKKTLTVDDALNPRKCIHIFRCKHLRSSIDLDCQ